MATTVMPSKQVWAHLLSQNFLFMGQGPGGAASSSCALSVWAGGAVIWLLSALFPSQLCCTALMAWAGSLGWLLRNGIWTSLRGLGSPSDPEEWHCFPGAVSSGGARAPCCSRCQEQQSMAWSSVSVLPGQTGSSCSSKASCSGSAAPAVSGSQGA